MRIIMKKQIESYRRYLLEEEKSLSTVNKYVKSVLRFKSWLSCKGINKSNVLAYKELLTQNYSIASVNTEIASLNSFFGYMH